MTTNRGKADGPARRAFEPRSWPKPPGLALLALALFGLIQAGCKSDGCSTCGFGNSISNGLQAVGNGVKSVGASIFHHNKGCGGGSDCGCGGGGGVGGYEEGVVIDQGIPVVPGGMVPAPTIVPAPMIDSETPQLSPLNSQPASPTSGAGSVMPKSTTSRSTPAGTSRPGYTTSLPKNGTVARKGSEADRASYSSSNVSNRSAESSGTADLLDSIPPFDMPSEVTRKAVIAPAATTPSPAPAAAAPAPTPAEKLSAADGGAANLPPIGAISSFQAPGLNRYASIAPSIAGGSAPSIEGLDWLREKGYRTLLDLRKSSEVGPNFVDAVNDRGMVYISLPIVANRLDSSRLARFDDLISRTENRPLFFCDSDGSRAALAWYIHQRVVGQENTHAATSKAEELGLGAAEIKLAEDYLATQKPKAKAAMARVAMANPSTTAEPAPASRAPSDSPEPAPLVLPETPSPPIAPAAEPVAPALLEEASPAMLPGEHRPQASKGPSPDYRDPNAWRPAAALMLTSIGVPLAFWGRTMISECRHVRRRSASLAGPAPRSLGAPAGSDA